MVLIPKIASQEAVLRNEFPGSQLPGSSQDVAKPAFLAPSWAPGYFLWGSRLE